MVKPGGIGALTAYSTIKLPSMLGWYTQMNAYSPGFVGAVKVFCVLPSTCVSNAPFGSEVTECSAGSLFSIATVAPGDTVIGSPNDTPEMVIVGPAVAAGPSVLPLGAFELPQPVAMAPIRRKTPSSKPILVMKF